MKRFMKYYRTKKGITLVLIALMLAVLLFFLGLAVDISYMYHVKNQLQVAADAAALAGAANLAGGVDDTKTNPNILDQEDARQEAWKFACKNRAGERTDDNPAARVYLATNDPLDCDTTSPPAAAVLNGANNINGDIVVGNWDPARTDPCPSTGIVEPFCPADGNTGFAINALKARPRRTPESEAYGMPKARVFIGQVFRVIGINWSRMNAAASAIAAKQPPLTLPLPICLPNCSKDTPVDGRWDYDKNLDDPVLCTDADSSPSSPPGQRFYLNPSAQQEAPGFPMPGLAWTNFIVSTCTTGCTEPIKDNVEPYITGTPAPDVCNKRVCTSNGDITPLVHTLQTQFDSHKKPYTFVTGSTTVQVTGWEVIVPVVSDLTCDGSAVTHACPGDRAGDPYLVQKFARVLMTEVFTSSDKGFRLIGLNDSTATGFSKTVTCSKKKTMTVTRWVTAISCSDCGTPLPPIGGSTSRLVK